MNIKFSGFLFTIAIIASACTPAPPPKRSQTVEEVLEKARRDLERQVAESEEQTRQTETTVDDHATTKPVKKTSMFPFPCSAQVGPDRDNNGQPDHCQGYIGQGDDDHDGTPTWRDTCVGDDCDRDGRSERWDNDPNESFYVKKRREEEQRLAAQREKARIESVRIEDDRLRRDQERRDQERRDQQRRDAQR